MFYLVVRDFSWILNLKWDLLLDYDIIGDSEDSGQWTMENGLIEIQFHMPTLRMRRVFDNTR